MIPGLANRPQRIQGYKSDRSIDPTQLNSEDSQMIKLPNRTLVIIGPTIFLGILVLHRKNLEEDVLICSAIELFLLNWVEPFKYDSRNNNFFFNKNFVKFKAKRKTTKKKKNYKKKKN